VEGDAAPGPDADAGVEGDAAPGPDADAGVEGDAAPGPDADAGVEGDAAPGPDADAGVEEDGSSSECEPGFEVEDEACVDINECTFVDCAADRTCVNLPGTFECRCLPGLEDKEGTCLDVDECLLGLDDCAAEAFCLNTFGGFACACPGGVAGVGGECPPAGRMLLLTSPGSAADLRDAGLTLGLTVVEETEWAAILEFGGTFEEFLTEVERVATRIEGESWTLVAFDDANFNLPESWQEALQRRIEAGGLTLLSSWELAQWSVLDTAYFGITSIREVESNLALEPVAGSLGPDLFLQWEEVPLGFPDYPSSLISPITRATPFRMPASEGIPLLTFVGAQTDERASVLTGPAQNVILNGFPGAVYPRLDLPGNEGPPSFDRDADGRPDLKELYVNQLALLLRPRVMRLSEAAPAVDAALIARLGMFRVDVAPAAPAALDRWQRADALLMVLGLANTPPTSPELETWVNGGRPVVAFALQGGTSEAWQDLFAVDVLLPADEADLFRPVRSFEGSGSFPFSYPWRVVEPVTASGLFSPFPGLSSELVPRVGSGWGPLALYLTAPEQPAQGWAMLGREAQVLVGFDLSVLAGQDRDGDGVSDREATLGNLLLIAMRNTLLP
jgi:hypothetical protein